MLPVLISGAGVVGLTLAHALRKVSQRVSPHADGADRQAGIPFDVYERDAHVDARTHGWAITLHWALGFLRQMLDGETLAAIDAVQVDPDVGRHDTGNFLFLDLATLETKFRIPPNERRRVNRERLRKALLRGVADHVHWGKRLAAVEPLGTDGVRARFADGSAADGSLLVGAEGSNSCTRRFLAPDTFRNYQLPVRLLGAAVDLSPAEAQPLRDIDPLLFQGCHPLTGNFLWVSLLETPDTNGSAGTPAEHYRIQIIMSWLFRDPDDDEVPEGDEARVAEMKRRAADFNPLLRRAVDAIPASADVMEIALQDWPCQPWDSRGGQVTLIGDAAHAMTMYRGEAANHGILDAYLLSRRLAEARDGRATQAQAVAAYEAEMRERTVPAVLLSRQACLDAHDLHGLNEDSAVLKRRAIAVK